MGRKKIYENANERLKAWRAKQHDKVSYRKSHKTYSFKYYTSPLKHIDWTLTYCNYHWDTDYLRELSEQLWQNQRLLVFIPRGHGKTFLTIALITRYILEVRQPVLIITSGPAQQRRIFRQIKKLLKFPRIREDYGNLIGASDSRTCELHPDDSITYQYLDPLLRVASRGAEIVGSHPTWIHIEDLIQEPFKSDESNESLIEWWGGIVEFCLTYEPGAETRITGTGTRKDKGDFWERLIEDYHYPHISRKSLELISGQFPTKNDITYLDQGKMSIDLSKGEYRTMGCIAWPLTRLLIERIFKPERFMAEMQNDPMPKGGLYFSIEHWIESKYVPRIDLTSYYMAVDPAFGKGQKADYTSILVGGLYRNQLYIVDGCYQKASEGMDVDHMINEIIRLNKKYHPLAIYIEANNFQFLINKILQLKQAFMPVEEVTNVSKKIERINSLKPYFINGSIFICESPVTEGLRTEYLSYNQSPSTAYRKDDALDTLEMIIRKISYLFSERQLLQPGWL